MYIKFGFDQKGFGEGVGCWTRINFIVIRDNLKLIKQTTF